MPLLRRSTYYKKMIPVILMVRHTFHHKHVSGNNSEMSLSYFAICWWENRKIKRDAAQLISAVARWSRQSAERLDFLLWLGVSLLSPWLSFLFWRVTGPNFCFRRDAAAAAAGDTADENQSNEWKVTRIGEQHGRT
jgi:hypothetical protein